eukprot:scaffold8766_cov67-Skeletonema_dohrnii-CCMP3373.AAC.3
MVGHLRRLEWLCGYKEQYLKRKSFFAIVTNNNGPLKAVDCSTRSVRYDMVVECGPAIPIWTSSEPEQWQISFYAIVTNNNGPLKAVDCSTRSVRYDMVLKCCWRPSQIGPHQVTYDAAATLIRNERA